MTLLQFMSDSPWLTFFIIFIIALVVVEIVRHIAYVIRGNPNILDDEDDEQL